ncbi:histidine kinase : Coagulation factor 5/8 type domain protein OS=Chthoniobacter flavus Ellin428 GN=CfE428DRAFT_3518 PE=4 SV=1: F5_F8_type_C: HisKA_3: HATPase_c [Gemmataceae bacterium]|nr:histidine kinase : Coagulation factor 5/8 type domain protein OS=Chthoniobacter flavus Ellin428 GN=CfE428DRAFT_3518 PE=4 SV=1: F5_F8_type_C: HisKA_3: HATPase_c [Gemmataceae bacterium]VTT98299.1 histidine kinase : Coagulation factor 5/8 type domain protein OS=Chthoniobacter flavus Ellin428 GN=CfE428DRAFT_3518 PE=4 SV=1: F5_F8_type_C: HisKA_3: HATPase_c [Gemmataceae bacterium]
MLRRAALALAVVLVAVPNADAAQPTALDRLAKLVSPDFRALDERRRELRADTPAPRAPLATCPALGYHSRAAYTSTSARWVQIDLYDRRPIDTIVIVPAVGPPGEAGPGYLFPRKMRVEVADQEDLSDAFLVAEIEVSTADRPVIVPANQRPARFVRVTATFLNTRGSLFFFALGEVLVLSANRNVAAGCAVVGSDPLENGPVWSLRNLVDGQGIIGPPLAPELSPANGYHSEISPVPDAEKWVQVDLGEDRVLEEVRLVPARPSDFAERSGFGFPLRFRVEVSPDAGFRSRRVLLNATAADFPNPGDGLVVVPADGFRGRYVRVTATRLWERTQDYVFALAELQVYSGGTNVALGRPVTARDTIERGLWGTRHLVDGYASQHRLAEWPEWAAVEAKTTQWHAAWRSVEAALESARGHAYARLVTLAGWLAVAAVALVGVVVWRGRVARRREAERLRDRISRDLHDEVGSNLGGILLLAQAGDAHDLPEIARVAQRTADSLRDLVWLMGRGPDTSADLLAKLRESAATLLVGVTFTFDAPDGCLPARVSLEFKRQLFLAFKEILHNIARHARARNVTVRCDRVADAFLLTVTDDGVGFDAGKVTAGTGLRGIRFRVTNLGGELTVQTVPGGGTTLTLHVPIG